MKCQHCGFEYLQKGQECGCRQAHRDWWEGKTLQEAYDKGSKDFDMYARVVAKKFRGDRATLPESCFDGPPRQSKELCAKYLQGWKDGARQNV